MDKIKRKNILLLISGILILVPLLISLYENPSDFLLNNGATSFSFALGVLTRLLFSIYLIIEGLRK